MAFAEQKFNNVGLSSFSFMDHAFGVRSKNLLPSCRSWQLFSCFFKLLVFTLKWKTKSCTLKSLIYVELIFVYDWGSFFNLWMYNCFSTIFQKGTFYFPSKCFCIFVKNQMSLFVSLNFGFSIVSLILVSICQLKT